MFSRFLICFAALVTFTAAAHAQLNPVSLRTEYLKVMPENGPTSQCFWATPSRRFIGQQQSKRALRKTDQGNEYLFTVSGNGPIGKLRFDPFATYDQYANVGEMQIESIAVYRLAK